MDRRGVDHVTLDPFGLQHPVDPEAVQTAPWMTIIGKSQPVRAGALRLSSANRRSSSDTSLAGTECLDIFPRPQEIGT